MPKAARRGRCWQVHHDLKLSNGFIQIRLADDCIATIDGLNQVACELHGNGARHGLVYIALLPYVRCFPTLPGRRSQTTPEIAALAVSPPKAREIFKRSAQP